MTTLTTTSKILTANEALVDQGVSHAIHLQRLATHEATEIVHIVDQALIPDLERQIEKRLTNIATRGYDTGVKTTARLKAMAASSKEMVDSAFRNANEALKKDLVDIGITEARFQTKALSTILKSNQIVFDVVSPSVTTMRSITSSRPFQGKLLNKQFSDLALGTQKTLMEQLTIGLAQGESVPALTRRIRPVVELSKRHTETLVRTATNHVSTQAREITYAENDEVIKGVQFLATLDSRTSDICQSLDGEVFKPTEGPRPPMHHQCRSTTVPVLKSWKELGIPLKEASVSTRASMNGQVASSVKYPEWLKKQSIAVQNEALGVRRATLFRQGKYKIPKYKAGPQQKMTLQQLQKKEGLKVTKPSGPLRPFEQVTGKGQPGGGRRVLGQLSKAIHRAPQTTVPTSIKQQAKFVQQKKVVSVSKPKYKAPRFEFKGFEQVQDKITAGVKQKRKKVVEKVRTGTVSMISKSKPINKLTMKEAKQEFIKVKKELKKTKGFNMDLSFRKSDLIMRMSDLESGSIVSVKKVTKKVTKKVAKKVAKKPKIPKPKKKVKSKFEGGENVSKEQMREESKNWIRSLNDDEYSSLKAWAGKESHDIRAFQAGKKMSPYGLDKSEVRKILKGIDSALERGPVYRGQPVYRGLGSLKPKDAADLAKKGSIQDWTQLSSTTKSAKVAKNFGRGRSGFNTEFVEFKIKNNKSGVDISRISNIASEQEVLKPAHSRYKVIKSTRVIGKGPEGSVKGWVVELEEL